ncbi:MAG: hypothetical protein ACXW36_06900 [Nitrospira sp.]
MRLKTHQWAELAGIFFLLASTGTQIFYVEPLRREIEWRLAAFNMQQNGQLQMKVIYDSRIALLRGLKSPESEIANTEAERKVMMEGYKNADANISDYLVAKEPVENRLQVAVVVLFAIGSLLAGFGRAMEMVAGHRVE